MKKAWVGYLDTHKNVHLCQLKGTLKAYASGTKGPRAGSNPLPPEGNSSTGLVRPEYVPYTEMPPPI